MSRITLRVAESDGTLHELPNIDEATLGFEFCDISSLSLDYDPVGINAGYLADGREIIAYIDGVEIDDGRWTLKGHNGDPSAEGGSVKWQGRSLHAKFEKVVCFPQNGDFNAPTTWRFDSATPGGILKALFDNAQARGAMAGFTYPTLNATNDANGTAWAQVLSIEYRVGVKYIDILRNLVDQGIIDWKLVGREIRVYNADTMGTDRTTTNPPVVLRAGQDYTETPFQTSIEELASHALIEGDNNKMMLLSDAGTEATWGREEVYISQGGTSNEGTLTLIAQAALDRGKSFREQLTRGLELDESQYYPIVDYKVGDYIFDEVIEGLAPERLRLRAMSLKLDDADVLGGSITLNDKFLEQEIRVARRVNGILGGASNDGGGNGLPASDVTDTTTPNAPTGLVVSSQAYTDPEGTTKAVVFANWNAPTNNTDGSVLADLQDYELVWRYPTGTDTKWKPIISSDGDISWSPVEAGANIEVKVRARDNSTHKSAYTLVVSHLTASDDTAPPVPSTPVISSRLGTMRVDWDGLGSAGESQPVDFSHIEVHMSTASGFTPGITTLVGKLTGKGSLTLTGLTYGTAQYFQFVAVDKVYNKSAASAEASGTPNRISGPDLQANSVTANEIAAGAITASEIALGSVGPKAMQLGLVNLLPNPGMEDADWRAALPLGDAWYYEQSTTAAHTGDWGVVINTSAVTIQYSNYQLCGGDGFIPCKPGDKFYMRQMVKAIGAPATAATFNLEVRQQDKTTVVSYDLRPASLVPSNADSNWHVYEGIVTIPAGAFWMKPMLKYLSATADAAASYWCFDDLDFRAVLSSTNDGGQAMEIAPSGFTLYDAEGSAAISLTSTPPNYLTINKQGTDGLQSVASISEDGVVSGDSIYATSSISYKGYDLIGQNFIDYAPGWVNGYANTLFDALPRGIVAHDWIGTYYSMTATEVGMVGLDFPVEPNRMYRVSGMIRCKPGAAAVAEYLIRFTKDGTVPKTTSPRNQLFDVHMKDASWCTLPIDGIFRVTPADVTQNADGSYVPFRLILTARVVGGSAPVIGGSSADGYGVWRVEDVGPYIAETGYANDGGASAPAVKATYTKRFYCTWSRSFNSSGAYNSYYGSECVQGYYSSTNGNQKAMIGFDYNAITTALSGSTVQACKFYAYANHWYNNSGGTAVIGTHNVTAAPASFSGTSNRLQSSSWPKPGGRVVSLGTTIGNEFKGGTSKGIVLGPGPSTSSVYYGKFNGNGASNEPYLEFTYTK